MLSFHFEQKLNIGSLVSIVNSDFDKKEKIK